jgi:hypothetical protein
MTKPRSVAATANDNSIPGSRLEAGTVSSDKVENNSIIDAKINDNANITATKLSYTNSGTGSVARTIDSRLSETLSVKDFGAIGDGVADDTISFLNAIESAKDTGHQVFVPPGRYKITDTLPLYVNTNIVGVNTTSGFYTGSGYASRSSILLFRPLLPGKDLFNNVLTAPRFRNRLGVKGLIIDGKNSKGRYAFNLNGVIYSHFSDLEIDSQILNPTQTAFVYTDGFEAGFNIVNSINNRFCNVYVVGCATSVRYSGSAPPTTDVWDQCTFRTGFRAVLLETGINIRFTNCLFEDHEQYGVEIYKDCRGIEAVSCYSENIPRVLGSGGSLFRVGYLGNSTSFATVLKVTGGSYSGRNQVSTGSFLDVDDVKGCQIVGAYVARFTNLVNCTSNTRDYGISIMGIQFNQIPEANIATGAPNKLSGIYDYRGVNSEGNASLALFDGLTVRGTATSNTLRLTPRSSAPTPSTGLIYYDSSLNKLRCYDGTSWRDLF